MLFALHSLLFGTLTFLGARYYRGNFPKWSFYLAISFKITLSFVIGYFYMIYEGGGDTLFYFNEARRFLRLTDDFSGYISNLLQFNIPWYYGEGRSLFFIKLISPIVYFSAANYWITAIYLALISFFAIWYLVRTLCHLHPHYKWVIYYAFVLFPSPVLWSAGIFKESIVYAALALSIALLLQLIEYEKKKYWLTIPLATSIVIIFLIKYFIVVAWLTAVCWILIDRLFKKHSLAARFGLFSIFGIVLFLLLPIVHPYLTLDRIPLTFYENYQAIQANTDPSRNRIDLNLAPNYISLVAAVPQALLTAFIRPIFGSYSSWLLVYRVENIFIASAFIITLLYFRSIILTRWVISGAIFIIILGLLYGLTTPNFGTLYRYKSSFLPYLILLISFIPYRKYFLKK